MAGRPLVGVAGEDAVVRKHFGDQPVVAASRPVVAGVRAAGGHPVVVPPGSDPDVLGALDALVLTGGPDVGVLPVRDREEIALLDAARSLGVPTLGLCRGLQLMAVADGGTLVPELGESHLLGLDGTHRLITVPGSVAADLVPSRVVGSLHHQSVATYDPRWLLTATAPDGVVEALEWHDQTTWPAVGVQWHPELDPTGPAVFGWLVEVSRRPSPAPSQRAWRRTPTRPVPA